MAIHIPFLSKAKAAARLTPAEEIQQQQQAAAVKPTAVPAQTETRYSSGGTAALRPAPPMPQAPGTNDASLADLGLTPGSTDPEMLKGLQSLAQALGMDPNSPMDLQKLATGIANADPIGKLKELGLDPGESLSDPKTVDAIKQLQEAAGINPTGKLDLETLLALVQASQNKRNSVAATQHASSPSSPSSGGASGGGGGGGGGADGPLGSTVPRRQSPGPQSSASGTSSAPGSAPSAGLSANQREAYQAAIQGDPAHGVPGMSPTAARALVANMSGESLSKPNDNHWDVHHMSQGIVQWDPARTAAIKAQFGKEPKDMTVAEQTHAAMWEINNNPRFSETKSALYGNGGSNTPRQMMTALVANYEAPAHPAAEIDTRMGFYNSLGNLA